MKQFLFIAFFFLSFLSIAQTENASVVSDDPKQAAKDKLELYRQRVMKGESMAVLATLYTEDPGSAKTGGYYRDISRGMFVPEFEEVAFKLMPGEISEIFETKYGYHFIQLVARRGDFVDLRHILIKFDSK